MKFWEQVIKGFINMIGNVFCGTIMAIGVMLLIGKHEQLTSFEAWMVLLVCWTCMAVIGK